MQVEGVKSGAHRGAEDVPVPALYRTEEFGDITGREPVTAQPVKNRAQGFIDSVTEAWYVATVDRMARVFLSLIHISEPTRLHKVSRMPSSA